jgi:Pentapeptide repeats (9 copies)
MWRPIPAWIWMLAAVAAVVIVAFVVTIWLLAIASGAKPGTDRANSRLDAVRTGLAAGAGAGAAVGLMLAFRRQHHQEIATVLTDLDATERRITELYTKAVEQLGNDKAPVRLGGLYALERLAQDNPAHRQTIVDVICAYLRMPFPPTAPAGNLDREDAWQQERQVRLTAQRILTEHLRDGKAKEKRSTDPPGPRFWPDIRLDLVGATLIDFDLGNGVIADANFCAVTFSGHAWFAEAAFSGDAAFDGATFNDAVVFLQATFGGRASFGKATVGGGAWFDTAIFGGGADFSAATFGDTAWFRGATFGGHTWFDEVTFGGWAVFEAATFGGGEGSLSFKRSRVLSSDHRPAWPTGWCLGSDGNGGFAVVRANDDG